KRNSKKRLERKNGERSHPADQTEDIQLTWAPASTEQQSQQQEESSAGLGIPHKKHSEQEEHLKRLCRKRRSWKTTSSSTNARTIVD
ncbi:hypothetical protein BGZ80_006965, partial [Entomortierella chlamydospora]